MLGSLVEWWVRCGSKLYYTTGHAGLSGLSRPEASTREAHGIYPSVLRLQGLGFRSLGLRAT